MEKTKEILKEQAENLQEVLGKIAQVLKEEVVAIFTEEKKNSIQMRCVGGRTYRLLLEEV